MAHCIAGEALLVHQLGQDWAHEAAVEPAPDRSDGKSKRNAERKDRNGKPEAEETSLDDARRRQQRRAHGLRPRSRRHGIVTRASSRLAASTTAILAASPSVLCVQR